MERVLVIEPKENEDALETYVREWVISRLPPYMFDLEALFRDVSHGCATGIVGELIYYNDTVHFYEKYRDEITGLVTDVVSEIGLENFVFPDWDKDDPFAAGTHNQNLLAWFGFEETARRLADRLGIEI